MELADVVRIGPVVGASFTSVTTVAAAVGTAIGTIGATVAAVYLGAIRPRNQRPKLTKGNFEILERPVDRAAGASPEVWLRLPISNAEKCDAAEDVEVVLRSVKSGDSRDRLNDRDLAGFSLKWTAVDGPQTLIPPGTARYLNIGYLKMDEAGVHRFRLDLDKGPSDDRPLLTWEFAEIAIVIAARNSNAVPECFGVRLKDGGVTTY